LKCLFRHLPKIALLAFNAFCLGTAARWAWPCLCF